MTEPITITRAFPAELTAGDGRTILGRCVPYDVPTLVADDTGPPYLESWRRGAFRRIARDAPRVRLVYEHHETIGDVIGHAVELHETDGGLDAVFRAIGAPGEQALELIRAGVVRGLSIQAIIPPSGSRTRADGVVERTLASLRHVALTATPAYADAVVTATRGAGGRATIAEIRRQQAALRGKDFAKSVART
jgi:HK97 family phage prohead protease